MSVWLHHIPHKLRIITFYEHVTYYAIVTDRVAWSVVRHCVTLVSPAKTAEAIELPFGFRTRVGPRNHELHGVQIPSWEGVILKGKWANHSKSSALSVVSCAKRA